MSSNNVLAHSKTKQKKTPGFNEPRNQASQNNLSISE